MHLPISEMTDQQVSKIYLKLTTELGKIDQVELQRELLTVLTEQFDELDSEDFFGTEGWERYLNFI